MYVLSVSRNVKNVNTYEEIFVGAILLRQKGEKIGLPDSNGNGKFKKLLHSIYKTNLQGRQNSG